MKDSEMMKKWFITVVIVFSLMLAINLFREMDLFNSGVKIVIPKSYTNLAELSIKGLSKEGKCYKSRSENDDGSITYVFTKKQHKWLMSQLSGHIEKTMKDTDDNENVIQIKANSDYTHFTFVTDGDTVGFTDSLLPTTYTTLGNLYSVFSGNPNPKVTCEYVNKNTGKVISNEKTKNQTTKAVTSTVTTTQTTIAVTTTETTEAVTDAPAEPTENTYEHNEYYDIVETAGYNNYSSFIGIHKVLAKKNATVSGTIIAYGEDGKVIGKSTDRIVLTEGKYNFFRYSFSGDMSNAKVTLNMKAENDSYITGERNAVEMVDYNKSGEYLYITLEQTGDEVGYLSMFKILLYKGDKIVGTESYPLSLYAKYLDGKGTTDVVSLWMFNKDFDRIEFVYEP